MISGAYFPDPRERRPIPARRRANTMTIASGAACLMGRSRPIHRPGVYMIPAAQYHRDPCSRPSLSHSVARIILDRSLMHARWAHPRLNPEYEEPEASKALQHGSVVHKLLLGRGEDVEVLHADDYRKRDTQDQRDAALARGAIPVLAHEFATLRRCADAVIAQMRAEPDCAEFFAPGRSEAVAVWRYGPVWCRAMIDRLPDRPGAPIFDVKSTIMSARPADWERSLAKRYATQAAFYRAGVAEALRRPVGEMRFVVFERSPPFAMAVVACGESLIEAAEAEMKRALQLWARAITLDEWPGYGRGVHRIEAPVHVLMKAEEAKLDFGRIAA